MPRADVRDPQSPRIHDVPLPGMVRCLTLQLNATYYRAGTCRWVGSLRDPEGGVEFDRVIGPVCDDDQEALDAMLADLMSMVASADYQLRGDTLDLHEAQSAEVPPPSDPPKRTRRRTATD